MAAEKRPGGRDEKLIAEANRHMQEADAAMKAYMALDPQDFEFQKKRGSLNAQIMKHVGIAWVKLCDAYHDDAPPDKVEVFRKNLHVLNEARPELAPIIDSIFSLHTRINTKLLANRNTMTGGFLSLAHFATQGADWQGAAAMGAGFVAVRTVRGFEALRNHAQDEPSRKLIQQEYDALMKKIEDLNSAMMQRRV